MESKNIGICINRIALIVKPMQSYRDWASKIYYVEPEASAENNIYLIRKMNTIYEIEDWIQINFDKIFTNELNDWTDEVETWPTDRTYKLFKEWFEV
jgi:hypothetical protein